jgi:hypothetical protein
MEDHSAQYRRALINILDAQNPVKGDMSLRAEGVFQAIGALGQTRRLHLEATVELRDAIVRACTVYRQVEMIGRGDKAEAWPTNRFALKALADLGWETPNGKKDAA